MRELELEELVVSFEKDLVKARIHTQIWYILFGSGLRVHE